MATPKKAKRILSLVRRTDSEKLKKIKSLQNKNRYLLKRMASLKELVKFLNNKGLIAEEAKNILMVHMYKSHQFKNMHIK
jgi:cell division protein FtsB